MGFFLETLLGGLMTGMLYALVAIGFVLIFKASGVFNFAQGAMVLFAALAMARFSEWIPKWLGMAPGFVTLALALIVSVIIMIGVAWLIERLALRHLVNQEPITLLMATLGIAYFMDGTGQLLFGSSTYKIDVGMPKDPMMVLEGTFQGGLLVSKEDLIAAARMPLAAEEMVETDLVQCRGRRIGGDVAADPDPRALCAMHHDRRVPADERTESSFDVLVTGEPGFGLGGDGVDVVGGRQRGDGHAHLARALQQSQHQIAGTRRPGTAQQVVERLEPVVRHEVAEAHPGGCRCVSLRDGGENVGPMGR